MDLSKGRILIEQLQLINKFSRAAGYKIHTQKSGLFLYTSNQKPQNETKKIVPFIIASKNIK